METSLVYFRLLKEGMLKKKKWAKQGTALDEHAYMLCKELPPRDTEKQ